MTNIVEYLFYNPFAFSEYDSEAWGIIQYVDSSLFGLKTVFPDL